MFKIKFIFFKIHKYLYKLTLLFYRIILRLIYGKQKRDELLKSGYFNLYKKINLRYLALLWTSSKFGNEFWEPKVSKLLKNIKGKIFVDVGASVGYYTLLLQSNFKNIIAIEPEPNSANKLRKNTKEYKNIQILQMAASNINGEITLFVSPTLGWHTITPNIDRGIKTNYKPIKVKTITLKKLLDKKIVDLVKVDTEGAEIKILNGAPKNNILRWLIEIHGKEERKNNVEKILVNDGYKIKWITDSHVYAYL